MSRIIDPAGRDGRNARHNARRTPNLVALEASSWTFTHSFNDLSSPGAESPSPHSLVAIGGRGPGCLPWSGQGVKEWSRIRAEIFCSGDVTGVLFEKSPSLDGF